MTTRADPKHRAVLHATIGPEFLREDTRVYDDEGWYRLITPSTPWPSANEVILSNVRGDDPQAVVDRIVAEYREYDLPLKWCVYPWSEPDDLGDRLVRRGAIHWRARGMACPTSMPIDVPEGLEVQRIQLSDLDVHVRAMSDGWGLPPREEAFMHERLGELLSVPEPKVQLFVARLDGVVAASASTVLREDSGYLMGANVLPDYRGRGVYRALLAGRLAALRQVGMPLATTHAREQTSAPMLDHLGFETVFRYELYQINPRPKL
jgi:GNAT superfamily N-acetyltransferase